MSYWRPNDPDACDCGESPEFHKGLPVREADDDPENEDRILCPECGASVDGSPFACGLLDCRACGFEWLCACCVKTAGMEVPRG